MTCGDNRSGCEFFVEVRRHGHRRSSTADQGGANSVAALNVRFNASRASCDGEAYHSKRTVRPGSIDPSRMFALPVSLADRERAGRDMNDAGPAHSRRGHPQISARWTG